MKHRFARVTIGTWLLTLYWSGVAGAQTPPEPEPNPPPAEETAPPAEPVGEGAPEVEAAVEAEAQAPAVEEATAEAPSEPSGGESADIVITGTRIRNTSFGRSAAPVDVIDRSQLEARGSSNLADMVQYMTAAQGGGIEGGVGGGAGAAASTASNINLRGLGVGTTLLLINGRRMNPTGLGQYGNFSDFSMVPMAAVERIDVLKAGASAIYGADAVGGVVNIITRRNWKGLRLEFDDKTTQNFDLNEYNFSAGFGAGFERGRVTVAAGYFRRGGLMASERDFPPDKFTRPNGFPGTFILPSGSQPDPACATESAPGTSLVLTMDTPTGCRSSTRENTTLISPAERVNAFSSGEYDLGDHVTVFGELGVSRFRGNQPIGQFAINTGPVTIPADHIDNPFGVAVQSRSAPLGGGRMLLTADDSIRGVLGLRGDFGGIAGESRLRDWTWEASASLGLSRFVRNIDDFGRFALQRALNSCSDPANTQNCFNPFFSSVDGTGTANSRAVINRIYAREVEISDRALQTYNAGISGGLLELPGGDLGIAFGAELRREWFVVDLDSLQNNGELLGIGLGSDYTRSRHALGGYLELLFPFTDWLELHTAGRVEYYNDIERAAISPFAGLTVTPLEGLVLRGNLSRSFRAPTMGQTYPGSFGMVTPVRLPDMSISQATAFYSGNPNLEPEYALTLSGGFQWSLDKLLRISADYWYYDFKNRIQPEGAQTLVDMWAAQGTMMSTDKVSYDPVTRMVTQVFSTQVNVPGSVITQGIDFDATFGVDGSSFGGRPDAFGRFSLGVQGTYTLSYTLPRVRASMAQRSDCDGTSDDSRCDLVGARNADTAATGSPPSLPHLRLNVPLTWALAGHSIGVIGHFISGVKDEIVAEPGTYSNGGEIPAWLTLDVQYGFTLEDVIGKKLALRVGVENLLDREPPYPNGTTVGYLADLHDPRGRMFYAKLSSEF